MFLNKKTRQPSPALSGGGFGGRGSGTGEANAQGSGDSKELKVVEFGVFFSFFSVSFFKSDVLGVFLFRLFFSRFSIFFPGFFLGYFCFFLGFL